MYRHMKVCFSHCVCWFDDVYEAIYSENGKEYFHHFAAFHSGFYSAARNTNATIAEMFVKRPNRQALPEKVIALFRFFF